MRFTTAIDPDTKWEILLSFTFKNIICCIRDAVEQPFKRHKRETTCPMTPNKRDAASLWYFNCGLFIVCSIHTIFKE